MLLALDLLDFLKPEDVLAVNAFFKTQGVNLLSFSLFGKQIDIAWPGGFTFPAQSWLGKKWNHEISVFGF